MSQADKFTEDEVMHVNCYSLRQQESGMLARCSDRYCMSMISIFFFTSTTPFDAQHIHTPSNAQK